MAGGKPKESEYLVYLYESSMQGESSYNKGNEGLSLTLVGTSITVSDEHELRPLVAAHIPSTGLYSNTGHMCNIGGDRQPRACFFCLLEIPLSLKDSSKDILIVMLCSGRQSLELFRPELEEFCEKLISPFVNLFSTGSVIEHFSGSSAADILSSWYHDCVLYLDRCVSLYEAHLPLLLYMCILTDIEVTGEDQKTIEDVKLFLEATSLSSLVENTTSVQLNKEETSYVPLELGAKVSGGDQWTVKLTSKATDLSRIKPQQFLCEWGKLIASKQNAFQRRQCIENFKLKIIQDVNSLKRLLQQAEADYHSLYRAYLFLCHSGNGQVLLNIAIMEASAVSSDSVQATAVVKAVEEFAKEKCFSYVRQ